MLDKQSQFYQKVVVLVDEVEKMMLERHRVKIVGSFTDKVAPVTVTLSFATDRKAKRMIYNAVEIERGDIKAKHIVGALEEAFGF